MTDTERGEERKHQVERYRLLAQEITDPLAAFLLSDQISKVEALLKGANSGRGSHLALEPPVAAESALPMLRERSDEDAA